MESQQSFNFNTTAVGGDATVTNGASLLERRQQTAQYLEQLQVPSLPPLSQLLTDKRAAVAENGHPSLIAVEQHPTPQQIAMNDNHTNNNNNNSNTGSPKAVAATLNHQNNTTNNAAATSATNSYQQMMYSDYSLPVQPNISPIITSITQDPSHFINVLEQTTASGFHPSMLPSTTTTPSSSVYAVVAAAAARLTDPSHHLSMAVNGLVPPPSIEGGGKEGGGMPYNSSSMERQRQSSVSSFSSDKVYSFVAIPGANQKKRPRRRYDEIERLYHCNWPGCTKSYGTLNHLNAHVSMQQHGPKRHPNEFKEMRKEWRRQKKERETQKKVAAEAAAHAISSYSVNPQLMQQQYQPFQSNYMQPSTMTLGSYY